MHFVRLARSGHVTVPAHQQTRHTGITHIITPSTTTTHHPLSPHTTSPPTTIANLLRQCKNAPHDAPGTPKRPWNATKTAPPIATRQHKTRRPRHIKNATDTMEHTRGDQERSKGHGKATGRAYKVHPPFFSFFFHVYWHSPPSPSTPTPISSSQQTWRRHPYRCVLHVWEVLHPSTITKHEKRAQNGAFFVFRRHLHPPSPPPKPQRTHLLGCALCVWEVLHPPPLQNKKNTPKMAHVSCFSAIPLQPHTRNTPIRGMFRVCVVAHLLLPTPEHKQCAISGAFFMFGIYSIPPLPSNIENVPVLARFQCLTTTTPLSLYDIPLPSLFTPSLPFPSHFFFHFRYFLFR